jgi:hypothetical protein
MVKRDVLEVVRVQPEVVDALHVGAFHTFQQFRPLLLQYEPLELLTQIRAGWCETRASLRVCRWHVVNSIPSHAAHETCGRQIAVLLVSQELRKHAGMFKRVARRGDRRAG